MEEVTLGSYPRGNTYTGRFPDHPISIHCSETNIPLAKSVELALGEYIKEGLNVVPVKGLGPRFIRVYLNGQPHFEEDGSVVFD